MHSRKTLRYPFPKDIYALRRQQWEEQRTTRQLALPKGLTLHWSGGEALEEPITLAPNGRFITSGAMDGTVRLWNAETEMEKILAAGVKPISLIAWSADGRLAAVARDDETIYVWNPETNQLLCALTGQSNAISVLAWSPNGEALACGTGDRFVQIWDVPRGELRLLLHGHARTIRSVSWSPDGTVLASGDDGGQIRLWDVSTGAAIHAIYTNTNGVHCLAWSPLKPTLLAAGSQDATIHLWDTETRREVRRLEGHIKQVTQLAFSQDGLLLVSQSVLDRAEVCFWRTDTWELLASLPINPFRSNQPLAFQTGAPFLLTGGDRIDEVRLWRIESETLLQNRKPTMHYANAKVVLMGDSGVGKTALFYAIRGERFRPTESTHARHVVILDNEEITLQTQGDAEESRVFSERREILLWDLAGQPGYRVVHQLHLKEVSLGLVVFDGRSETDPFAGVRYWDRALRQAHNVSEQEAPPLKKLLIAARIDRGGIPASQERTNELAQELGFARYLETSAKEGDNIEPLQQAIKESIDWESLPHVTSNEWFETIKAFLLQRRQDGRVLAHIFDLYDELLASDLYLELYTAARIDSPGPELYAQFERCISLVEARGLIARFHFENFLLLQPELLDAYASALINSVRAEPDGLGSILEDRARDGQFRMPPDERLQDKEQEKLLLLAMIEDLLRHELAFLAATPEGNYLIFPSQSMRVNHALPDPEGQALIFEFEGYVQNIYATLAVRLARSGLFAKQEIWKDAITFTDRAGGLCGLSLETIGEGRGRLTLFFNATASSEIRLAFEDYVEKYLRRSAITNSLSRFPLFTCSNCGVHVPHSLVLLGRKLGQDWLYCSMCGTRIEIVGGEEAPSSLLFARISSMDAAADRQRNLDVLHSTRRDLIEMQSGADKLRRFYDLFLCYSASDEPAVTKQLVDPLLARRILPWLDDRDVPAGLERYQAVHARMEAIHGVAVCIGEGQPPPWQDPQTEQLLRTFAEKQHILIPVILPNYSGQIPQRPDYIVEAWIDMRISEPDPITSLIERLRLE